MGDVILDHVTKRYADVTAVDDIILDIADGEFVTLVGPSGCGKSTTLESIAGLTDASDTDTTTAGTATAAGADELLMSVKPNNDLADDEDLDVVLDHEKIHVFDAETGDALCHDTVSPEALDGEPRRAREGS